MLSFGVYVNVCDSRYYVSGGTLRPDALCYVERRADRELMEVLLRREFAFVLTSRQMGKSSLMSRTAARLRERGVDTVVLDLTAIGQNVTLEQWYDGVLLRLSQQLRLEDELEAFWEAQGRLSPVQRLFAALRDVVLESRRGSLVIFVDEVDVVLSLPFATDEFFAAIRECNHRRIEDPAFERLAFCLLGVATPADLISDPDTTPFNVGCGIELTDFTLEEAAPLALGLGRTEEESAVLLERILFWTGGHPYLTQRLCRAVAESSGMDGLAVSVARPYRPSASTETVDQLCESMFLSGGARERDDNLLFVRDMMLRREEMAGEILRLYAQVRAHQPVRAEVGHPHVDAVRLSGVTRVEQGVLRVRNRIYQQVFDEGWISAQLVRVGEARRSIAVLPFQNLSSDPENEFLSDGFTEELIGALSRLRSLKVTPRRSIFALKGKIRDVRKVGHRLGVSFLVLGSIQRLGQSLRIHGRLVRVSDGAAVWSERYDASVDELFSVQEQMGHAVVEALQVELREEDALRRPRSMTSNIQAYQLYLRGRYHLNQRGVGIRKAVHYFELALLEDPHYALALAGLADGFNLLGFYDHQPPRDILPRARECAKRALELDANCAEALSALGFTLLNFEWNWSMAETVFMQALALNPGLTPAHYSYAMLLTALGRHEEAIDRYGQAVGADRFSSLTQAQLGWLLLVAGQYERARNALRRAIDLEPGSMVAHWIWGQQLMAEGDAEEAVVALEHAVKLSTESPWVLATLGYACGRSGRAERAGEILRSLEQRASASYVRPTLLAMVHLGMGHVDAALDWLERGLLARDAGMLWLKSDACYRSLFYRSRFEEIARRVGLPG